MTNLTAETTATEAVYPRVELMADGSALGLYLLRDAKAKPLYLGPGNHINEKQLRLLAVSDRNHEYTLAIVRDDNGHVQLYVVNKSEQTYRNTLGVLYDDALIAAGTPPGRILNTDPEDTIYLVMFAGRGYAFLRIYPEAQRAKLLEHSVQVALKPIYWNQQRLLMTMGKPRLLYTLAGAGSLEDLNISKVVAAVPMDDGYCITTEDGGEGDYAVAWLAPYGNQQEGDVREIIMLEGLAEPPVLKSAEGTAVHILYRQAGSDELRALLFRGFNEDGTPDLQEADPRDA